MISMTFVCEKHQDSGELGWRPEHQSSFDPYRGMTVAHDVLEHFPNDQGDAEDEFMALGAALWIRGGGGYWYRKMPGNMNQEGDHLSSDFEEIVRRLEGRRLDACRSPKIDDSFAEEQLELCAREARRNLRDAKLPTADVDKAINWMRRGYRKAAKRFKHQSPDIVTSLFIDIEDAAEAALKDHDAMEGDKLIVRVDLRHQKTHVTHQRVWDEEGDY